MRTISLTIIDYKMRGGFVNILTLNYLMWIFLIPHRYALRNEFYVKLWLRLTASAAASISQGDEWRPQPQFHRVMSGALLAIVVEDAPAVCACLQVFTGAHAL
jgi:hypothetical protein